MGFKSFWKHLIFGYAEDDPELQAAREKLGINMDEEMKVEDKEAEEYDHWDELRNMRMNFFFGTWATRKYKHRIFGEDKVKKQLAELEKKREEEAAKKEEEGRESSS